MDATVDFANNIYAMFAINNCEQQATEVAEHRYPTGRRGWAVDAKRRGLAFMVTKPRATFAALFRTTPVSSPRSLRMWALASRKFSSTQPKARDGDGRWEPLASSATARVTLRTLVMLSPASPSRPYRSRISADVALANSLWIVSVSAMAFCLEANKGGGVLFVPDVGLPHGFGTTNET